MSNRQDFPIVPNDHIHHVTLLQVLWLVRGLPHARTVNTAGMRVRLDPARRHLKVLAHLADEVGDPVRFLGEVFAGMA